MDTEGGVKTGKSAVRRRAHPPVRYDKVIKLIIVITLLLSFIILQAFLCFLAMSSTFNAVDTHILDELKHDNYTLLIIIIGFYFKNDNDRSQLNDTMHEFVRDRIQNPCNSQGEQYVRRTQEVSIRDHQQD